MSPEDDLDAIMGVHMAYGPDYSQLITMPIEGGAVSSSSDAPWWAKDLVSAGGYALRRYIDSEFPSPFQVIDPTRGLAVTPNGQVYVRGQPGTFAATVAANPLVVVGGLALLAVAAYMAFK